MVKIPQVAFNQATPQIGTTGGKFNVMSAVGDGLAQVGQAVQKQEMFSEQKRIAELKQAQAMQKEKERITLERDKRDASAYMPRTRTDFLLRHEALEAEAMNEQDSKKRLEIYSKGFEGLEKEYLDNAPNDIARQKVLETSQNAKLKFGQSFIKKHALQNQLKRVSAIEQSNDDLSSMVRQGMDYNVARDAQKENIEDLKQVTTPAKVSEIQKKQEAELKASNLDYLMEKEDFNTVKELLNDKKFTKGLPVSVIDQTRNKIKAQTVKNREMLRSDPAGYFEKQAKLEGRDPDFNEAIEAQKSQGIAAAQASVMGKDTASDVRDRMMKIDSPAEMQVFINGINEKYGAYSRNAFNDLKKAGLPREYSFISQLDPIQDAQEMSLAFDVIKSGASVIKENAKQVLAGNNVSMRDFQNEFYESNLDLNDVMIKEGASPAIIEDINHNNYMLSLAHVAKYKDSDKAIEFISKLPFKSDANGGGYKIASINGTNARIPHALDEDDIEDGLDYLIEQNEIFVPSLSETIKDIVGMSARDNSYWSLTPDGKGMLLRNNEDYTPLLDDNLNVISYSFEDIMKAQSEQYKNILSDHEAQKKFRKY